jgi:hypothetical protein
MAVLLVDGWDLVVAARLRLVAGLGFVRWFPEPWGGLGGARLGLLSGVGLMLGEVVVVCGEATCVVKVAAGASVCRNGGPSAGVGGKVLGGLESNQAQGCLG